MKNSHGIRCAAVLAVLLWLVPLFASADTVVPRGDHEAMKNAGVKVMARPKAWDDIDKPLTAAVTAANPLEMQLCTSYRSPYAYLGMDRYAALEMDYNVKVDVKYVFPIAIRDPSFFAKASDYRYLYDPHDMARIAKRRGIPYFVDFSGKTWVDPVKTKDIIKVAPKEEQDVIYNLYAVSTLVQTEHPEHNLAFAQRMFRRIYDGTAPMTWPDEMDDVLDEIGLNGKAIVKKALKNRDKYIEIVEANQEWCHAQGHGGVPVAVFRGEPFWGQDRIQTVIWRMKQNGLTARTPLVGAE